MNEASVDEFHSFLYGAASVCTILSTLVHPRMQGGYLLGKLYSRRKVMVVGLNNIGEAWQWW